MPDPFDVDLPHMDLLPTEGVEVEYRWHGFHVVAGWPERRGRHDVVATFRAQWLGALNPRLLLSETRVNLISDSAKKGLISSLRVAANTDNGDILPVAEFVHAMCDNLLSWYRWGGQTTHPTPQPPTTDSWLLYPIWPRSLRPTAIVAAPGTYKSLFGQAIGLQLLTGAELLAGNTTTAHTPTSILYLDWETDEQTFAERTWALCNGNQLDHRPWLHYKRMKTPLVDAAPQLADEIMRHQIDAVILDSMSRAIGGPLTDDDSVNAYWNAVATLTVPNLTIAHKSAENAAKRRARFFGSFMSEGAVGMAWNAERDTQGRVVWECFKDNRTNKLGATLAWQTTFHNTGTGHEETLEAIRIEAVNPNNVRLTGNVAAAGGQPTVADDIEAALVTMGPQMPGELAQLTGSKEDTIRRTLNRHSDRFRKLPDGRWRTN